MRLRPVALAMLFAGATGINAHAATLDVFEMSMTTSVRGNGGQNSAYVLTPTNPLVTSRHAQIGMTEATTVFDLAWGPNGGRFDFLFDQVIEDSTGYVASEAFGGVGIVSDVDLWLDYQYTYSYDNLNGEIAIDSTTRISHITGDGFTWLLDNIQLGGAGHLQAPSGTYSSTFQGLLPAGEQYGISFFNGLDSTGEHGAIGTGTGSLHFTLTPVPEPASALLLAFAGVAALRRRRSSAEVKRCR